MDKKSLKMKLIELIQEGKKYTFDSFPTYVGGKKSGSGVERLLLSDIPEWNAWTQRVKNTIYHSFKKDSAPCLLISNGLKSSQFYRGTNKDRFQKTKDNFVKGLELALDAVDDDSYNEIIEKIEKTKNQPENITDNSPPNIYNNTFHAPVTGIQQGGQNNTLNLNPEITTIEISQGIPTLEELSKKETLWTKLWRFSESNFFWGGGVAVALASYAFLLTNAVKFSIFLLLTAWVVITISIFRYSFFENKTRKFQIIINSFISFFIAICLCLAWVWLQPSIVSPPLYSAQSNIELKNKAIKLSDDILQFASDKQLSEPKSTFNYNENVVNKNSPAFKRAMEDWNRDTEVKGVYYKTMQDDFLKRFGGEYASVINDLKNRGVKVESKDNFARTMTNPLTMQDAAMRLKVLANQIPDTK